MGHIGQCTEKQTDRQIKRQVDRVDIDDEWMDRQFHVEQVLFPIDVNSVQWNFVYNCEKLQNC